MVRGHTHQILGALEDFVGHILSNHFPGLRVSFISEHDAGEHKMIILGLPDFPGHD